MDRCRDALLTRFSPGEYCGLDECRPVLGCLYEFLCTEVHEALATFPDWRFYQLLFSHNQGWAKLWEGQREGTLSLQQQQLVTRYGPLYRRVYKQFLESSVGVDFVDVPEPEDKELLYKVLDRAIYATCELCELVSLYYALMNFDSVGFRVKIYPRRVSVSESEDRAFSCQPSPEFTERWERFKRRYDSFERSDKTVWQTVYANSDFEEFEAVVREVFGFSFKDAVSVLVRTRARDPDIPWRYPLDASELGTVLSQELGASSARVGQFLAGITLTRRHVDACPPSFERPCSPFRLLYRPILEWTIDDRRFAFFSQETLREGLASLVAHGIGWGRVPDEWSGTAVERLARQKQDARGRALVDAVTDILREPGWVCAQRLDRWREESNVVSVEPGEIDVAAVDFNRGILLLIECKAFRPRSDIPGWYRDWESLQEDSGNVALFENKLDWARQNTALLVRRIGVLNNLQHAVRQYQVQGMVVTAYPTFASEFIPVRAISLPEVRQAIEAGELGQRES